MTTVVAAAEHVWRWGEIPLCTLEVEVSALSGSLGLVLNEWEEPGLGNALGFACRLAAGLVVRVEQLAHAKELSVASGPVVYMVLPDLVMRGIENSLGVVLAEFGLARSSVGWTQTELGLQAARERLSRAAASNESENGARPVA